MYRWDSENLSLYQTMLTFILQPYSRVNTENPYPILDLFPDLLMLKGLRKVVVLPAVPIFKCHLPGNLHRLNFSSNSLVLRQMIPYSRPKLSVFYTLFQSKLAENHTLHSDTYLYSSYMGVPPGGGIPSVSSAPSFWIFWIRPCRRY